MNSKVFIKWKISMSIHFSRALLYISLCLFSNRLLTVDWGKSSTRYLSMSFRSFLRHCLKSYVLYYRSAVGWTTFPCGSMRTSSAPCIPLLCAHAAGSLVRTSCPNSRGKVCPQEWQSFGTTNFVDISHPRSSQQPRTGFKDRPVILNSTFGILYTTV